jgi:MFS transporter, Spinster family, sphingosine-1-phosphate transporter
MHPIAGDDSRHMQSALESSSPSSALPAARLSLVVLLSINLLNYIDRFVLSAVEPKIREEFGITRTQSGYLPFIFIISYMICAPIFGWLADRFSRWLIVGFSVLLWSAATAASGLAGFHVDPTVHHWWSSSWALLVGIGLSPFVVMLLTRMFVGVGEGGYGPTAPTIISDLYPVSRRGYVLAWFYVAMPVGGALGYVVGTAVGASWGWRSAFFIVTIPGVMLGLWTLFMKDPPRGTADVGHAIKGLPKLADYTHLIKIRSYVLNTLAMAAMAFSTGGMSYWMPDYLEAKVGLGGRGLPENAGMIFGIITAVAGLGATILGGLAGDKLRDRFGGSYFLVSGVSIMLAAPFMIAMLYVPFPYAWGMLFASIFFLFFNTGPANTALANVVSPTVRASAFAINIFVLHLVGDAPAPYVLGMIHDHFSAWNPAFFVVAGSMVVAGIFWMIGTPHLKQDTDAVTNPKQERGFPIVMPG